MTHANRVWLKDEAKEWQDQLVTLLSAVLQVFGWPDTSHNTLKLPEKAKRIVNLSLQLNEILMQKIFSMRVEVIWFPASEHFDPACMAEEGVVVISNARRHRKIYCCKGLGLKFSSIGLSGPGESEVALKVPVVTSRTFQVDDD